MSKFYKKMKNLLAISATMLLFLLVWFPVSLNARDCRCIFNDSNTTYLSNELIEIQLQSFLDTHYFPPFDIYAPMVFEVVDAYEDGGLVFVMGFLRQGAMCLCTHFAIGRSWFDVRTDMLYMSTVGPLFPGLFEEISFSAARFLQAPLSSYYILIAECNHRTLLPAEGVSTEVWTFFNQDECVDLLVIYHPNSDGDADFSISSVVDTSHK